LQELDFDTEVLGFDIEFINDLIYQPDFSPATEDEQGKLDQKEPIVCPECGHSWQK
jgi:hypothetical protein